MQSKLVTISNRQNSITRMVQVERDPVRRDSRMHAVVIDDTTTDYEALRGPSGPAD